MTATPGATSTPKPPKYAARYVRAMLAFGVSVAVGLLPLLGKLRIPGFVTILEILPFNLHESLVPFAAFVMAVPAVAVQFFSNEKIRAGRIRRAFLASVGFVLAMIFTLYIVLTLVTVSVPVHGHEHWIRFVVGENQKPDCECTKQKLDISVCIGTVLSVEPAPIENCFPSREIRRNKLLVSLPYLLLMCGFGTMIGLLVVKEAHHEQKAHHGGKAKPSADAASTPDSPPPAARSPRPPRRARGTRKGS